MTPPRDYRRRLGHIAVQVRAHDALPWTTIDRTDNPREAAGRSQGLAPAHPHVRVVDRQGHVRIEYAEGIRLQSAGAREPEEETYRERQTRRAQQADAERARIDSLRAAPPARVYRTVVADGREFVSIWDGKGALPGARIPGEW
jgi:hypothetical protein